MKLDRNHVVLEFFSIIISLMATLILGGSIAVFAKMYGTSKLGNSTDAVIGWVVLIFGIVFFVLLIATARAMVLFLDIEAKLGRSVIIQEEILLVLKEMKIGQENNKKTLENQEKTVDN